VRIPYRVAWLTGWATTAIADRVTHRPPAVPLEAVKMARFHMYFSTQKAVRELGLPQTSTEIALRDALTWFEARGYFAAKPERRTHGVEPGV
jgi:dihydroflavonol-4-reductase